MYSREELDKLLLNVKSEDKYSVFYKRLDTNLKFVILCSNYNDRFKMMIKDQLIIARQDTLMQCYGEWSTSSLLQLAQSILKVLLICFT